MMTDTQMQEFNKWWTEKWEKDLECKPFDIWQASKSLNDERNAWLKADHAALCEIINGIDDADLTYKEGDSVNVKALKDFIRLTNERIVELEAASPPTDKVSLSKAEYDALVADAERYRYCRNRDIDTIRNGGIFIGKTPDNLIITGDDCDEAIDNARSES